MERSDETSTRETSPKRGRDDTDTPETSDRHKRARQNDLLSSSNVLADPPVLWADYVCDNSDDSDDSSYAPSAESSEDDDAGMTQQEIFESWAYQDGEIEKAEYVSGDLTSDSECFEEDSDDEITILWKDYPSEEESDSDDPDYIPPSWNFEDVLEIISPSIQGGPYYQDLDRMRYMNEVIQRGPMSEAGVTSDSDTGEYELSSLHRRMDQFQVPQHLRLYSTLAAHLRNPIHRRSDKEPLIDLREKNPDKWYNFYVGTLIEKAKKRREEPGRRTFDMNDRLNTVLTNDHLQYAFDDWEWKAFENMTMPYSSTRKHGFSDFEL